MTEHYDNARRLINELAQAMRNDEISVEDCLEIAKGGTVLEDIARSIRKRAEREIKRHEREQRILAQANAIRARDSRP